jgi:imidazoleglycerol phosphate synthase glutamine amidotransferase subunit HisH
MMVSILNYGFGNIASISNMLKKIGASNKVISTAKEIEVIRSYVNGISTNCSSLTFP